MKRADKIFAFLVWIEVLLMLILANLEATKPFAQYMIFIFFLTVIYGYTRKSFIKYFSTESYSFKIMLAIVILGFLVSLAVFLMVNFG